MTCELEARVGVVGLALEIEVLQNCTTALNLTTASVKEITVQRPDKTTFTRTADFVTDGSDGLISIDTIAGDLTIEGTYYIQAYLELPSWQGHSDVGEFEVHDNLG